MAITAQFTADFSQFSTEVKKAETQLNLFEKEAGQAGKAVEDLGTKTGKVIPFAKDLTNSYKQFDGALSAAGINIGPAVKGIEDIAGASGKTAGELGKLATAGLVVGTALAAWNFGRSISELLGLDKAIGDTAAKWLGWGDVGKETAGAVADALAAASQRAGRPITDMNEALRINTEWMKTHKAEAKKTREETDAWTKANQEVTIAAQDHSRVLGEMNPKIIEAAKFALQHGVDQKSVATAYKLTAPEIAAVVDLLGKEKKALEDRAAMTAVMKELDAAGLGWKGTLAGINGEMIEAVKYYLEAGVSQNTLATAYGLTAGQIKAVAEAMREEKQAAKEAEQQTRDSYAAIEAAAATYEQIVRRGSTDTTQQKIDDAWRAADEQINALAKLGTGTTEAYDLIIKTAEEASRQIIGDTLAQDNQTRDYYERLARNAEQASDRAMQPSERYTTERLEQLRKEAEGAKTTLLDWQGAAAAALTGVKGAADQAREAVKTVTEETERLWGTMKAFQPGQILPGGQLPGSGNVREVERFGGRYVVDTRTGETLAALTRQYGAGGFLGWGYNSPGEAQRVNQIIINGSVLSDADNIARVVGDALAGHYGRSGNRLPV